MTFMILTPYKVSFMNTSVEAIPLVYTGSAGLFGAIIASLISVEIYTWFIRKKYSYKDA